MRFIKMKDKEARDAAWKMLIESQHEDSQISIDRAEDSKYFYICFSWPE